MRIEELSIGDWVCAEQLCGVHNAPRLTPPMKVVGLGESWVNLEIDSEQGDPFEFEPCEIRGVTITPEILEKNGFAFKHKGIEFDHYETNLENGKTLLLSFDRGEHYYLMIEEKGKRGLHQIDCPLGYVHQLQHAIRLAGIEKEIEL